MCFSVQYLGMRGGTVLTETYAVRQVTRDAVMAYGMEVSGLLASSPVVAIISKPMKA